MGVTKPQEFTSKKKQSFLEVLRKTGNISRAAKTTGYSRRAMYDWREKDAEFAKAWDDAIEECTDELEQEVRRRALEGVEEPVFGKTGQIGAKQKYSDVLAIFMLKGNRPEKYRERYEISGDPNKPIKVQEVSDEHLEAIVANGVVMKSDSGD